MLDLGSPTLLRVEYLWSVARKIHSERFSEDEKEAQDAMIEHLGLHFSV